MKLIKKKMIGPRHEKKTTQTVAKIALVIVNALLLILGF